MQPDNHSPTIHIAASLAEGTPVGSEPPGKLDAIPFLLFKALFCVKITWWQLLDPPPDAPGAAWRAGVLGICFWACLPARWWGGLALLAALQAYGGVGTFPYTINHRFFELGVSLLLLALPDPRALRAIRALFLSALLWAGVQKAAQGRYLSGELYAWFALFSPDRPLGLWLRDHVPLVPLLDAGPLAPIVPAPDWLRRTPVALSSGARTALVALSWATVLAELALPAMLAARRTRLLGVAGTVGLFWLIDASTHERSFVLTSLLCTALFLPGASRPARTARPIGRAVLVLGALLACWLPVHIAASRALGFSAWRLAGFGMYATLHETQRQIRVFPLTGACGPLATAPSVRIRSSDPGAERLAAFPSAAAAAALVARLPEPQTRALVWLIEPRLDVSPAAAYGDVRGWLVENGRARAVAGFASGEGRAEARFAEACGR